MEVEPFPRFKLIKICQRLLTVIPKHFGEESLFRLYWTEKVQWIMDVTHKYEDVEALEAAFKVTEIEELISQLVDFEVESVLIAEMERDGVMNDEEELK